jgi:hypothetical protein
VTENTLRLTALRFAQQRTGEELAAAFAEYYVCALDGVAEGETLTLEAAWIEWRQEIAGC